MTTQAPVRTGQLSASAQVAEQEAWSTHGIKVLAVGVGGVLGAVVLLWSSSKQTGDIRTALTWTGILVLIAAALLLAGLTPVVPGQARVIQLFGKYRGTTRDPGLQWVNPFTHRVKVSTRIRNHETAPPKVNDADGNPIEIAAVVVWQVQDTAKAIYAVDEYTKFVAIQTEQASAVVGARQKIVEGAVGMVQLALQRLEEQSVVELDEERKAAMVSNLLVVLCSEQATQQVVNTGSLYQ